MSSTFSVARLGKLITKQLFENSRLYIFSVLALFGLLALIFTFWISFTGPNYHEEGIYIIFLFGLFIAGGIFASMSFNILDSKDKGIYWLGVPATHFEKLICTIFYTTVLFTIVYCLCFFLIKSVSIAFLTEYIKTHPGNSYSKQNFDNGFGAIIKYFICAFFAVQAFYLLGSVYFSRYSFVITTVAGAVLIFAFVYYISRIQHTMFNGFAWDLTTVRKSGASIKDGYWLYSVSPTASKIFTYTVQFAWAPLFWIVTWFRLKEKEL